MGIATLALVLALTHHREREGSAHAFQLQPPKSSFFKRKEYAKSRYNRRGDTLVLAGDSSPQDGDNNESKNLLQKVKDAGTAGAISYALWEAAFWGLSIPICLVGYRQVTGDWPDLTNSEDVKKVGMEAFAFVNFARLAVPLRIGLALSTVPWVEENIITRFKDVQATETKKVESMSEQVIASAPFENLQQSISEMEESLMGTNAELPLVSSGYLDATVAGLDPNHSQTKEEEIERRYAPGKNNIDACCEPGKIYEDCSKSIQGYLDSLASTPTVAMDEEVETVVGYLDSLSSNVAPNEKTGATFTSYLDELSSGYIPVPSPAKAVATYSDILGNAHDRPRGILSQEEEIGSRINEVEKRLNRLEVSVSNLPDNIVSRWQLSQGKRQNDEVKKIMESLVDGNFSEIKKI